MSEIFKILTSIGLDKYALIILALSIFIDINPGIKFNPIKAVLNYLGKCFNSSVEKNIASFKTEVNEKLTKLQEEQNSQRETLNKIITDSENREMSRLRWDVIEFENSILNGQKHSREQYRHILDCAKKFKRMAETSNNITIDPEDLVSVKESEATIQEHYDKNRLNQSMVYF